MSDRPLLIAATAFEVQPTLVRNGADERAVSGLGRAGTLIKLERFDCLITGVGQMQCAVHLTRLLECCRYRCVVQAGIAGSFSDTYPKGAVVCVAEQVLADFGAESPDGFLDIVDMGLLPRDHAPFTDGILKGMEGDLFLHCNLPRVRGATVNRTLSNPHTIGWILGRYAPDVVAMEGAALFYACLTARVPFLELRAISDLVGPRDKSQWDIPGSINALNEELTRVVEPLLLQANE
jgi:futalosine hydrolase